MVHAALLARHRHHAGPMPLWLLIAKGSVLLFVLVFMVGTLIVKSMYPRPDSIENHISRKACQWNPWCITVIWDINHDPEMIRIERELKGLPQSPH